MKLDASSPMNLADELDGRVGGEGGAPDGLRVLEVEGVRGYISGGSDLWMDFPRGRVNLE